MCTAGPHFPFSSGAILRITSPALGKDVVCDVDDDEKRPGFTTASGLEFNAQESQAKGTVNVGKSEKHRVDRGKEIRCNKKRADDSSGHWGQHHQSSQPVPSATASPAALSKLARLVAATRRMLMSPFAGSSGAEATASRQEQLTATDALPVVGSPWDMSGFLLLGTDFSTRDIAVSLPRVMSCDALCVA
jgi:hypothetical protein